MDARTYRQVEGSRDTMGINKSVVLNSYYIHLNFFRSMWLREKRWFKCIDKEGYAET